LIADALRQGDNRKALRLARRALALQPKSGWTLVTLFDLEVRGREWDRAEETLSAAVRNKAIGQYIARRHRAALKLARSAEAEEQGEAQEALAHARRAHEMLPDFVPAAVRTARLLAAQGKPSRAARIIERSWRVQPHPDLAGVWNQLAPSDPLARYQWMERLQTVRANAEGRIAAAEAALNAKLWGEARGQLVPALDESPDARSRAYRLLARLEQEERNDVSAARDWLARAAEAPTEPAWTCHSCGVRTPFWRPTCEVCGSFDAFEWRGSDMPVQLPRPTQTQSTALTVPPIPPAGPVDVPLRHPSRA
jgi:HemY protein